ncbi:hypothetical protein AB1Y20_021519 [Prymnesium parvum]|uniref:Hexosyltransferase n=1 Tax=Prymnesium parvum TaxID=97485 RepID=A0AB34JJR9_PRYPA
MKEELHPTSLEYLRRSTPCGSLRIQKLRAACLARLTATTAARDRRSSNLSAHLSADLTNGGACERGSRPEHGRLAVCLFGALARFDDARGAHHANLWLTRAVVRPSLHDRVIRANGGWRADVFVHSWQSALAPFIERTFRPLRSEYGVREDGRTGMFLSIERVLLLRQQAEEERSLYDWVLLTRLDVVWMRRLPLHALNSSLFYVANWCVTTGSPRTAARAPSASCRSLETFAPDTHQVDGVPDYYFLANPQMVDRVFMGMTGDLLRGALRPTPRSCCNHAILAGRLKQLGLWDRIGRALYHHMDLENLRVPKFDMDRVFCHLELSKWADFDPEAIPRLGCPDQTALSNRENHEHR